MKTAHPQRRLLMVLDHRMRGLAEAELASTGWLHEWVSSAAEAISRLERSRFDALLTQAELPDSSGRGLLQHILYLREAIPVVFLACPGKEKEIALALEHGAAGYVLAGPGLAALLPAVLEHAFEGHQSRQLERRGRDLQHRNELRDLATALRHEINNPLTGILGNAEMGLAMPGLPEVLERRLRNVVRMAEQIRQVLQALEHFPDQRCHLLGHAGAKDRR